MKFLMMIKHAEGAPGLEHPQGLYEAMGKFVEESFKSGILKDTAGLKRTEHGYADQVEGRQADADRRPVHRVQGSRRRLRDRRNQDAGKRPTRSRSSSWSCIASTCRISSANAKCGPLEEF